jgi:hypothetical protein
VSTVRQELRIEVVRQAFSHELFEKYAKEGQIFGLENGEEGKVKILTEFGSFVVTYEEIEFTLERILGERESQLALAERNAFASRFAESVKFIGKDQSAPEGLSVLGEKDGSLAVAKVFLQ